MRRLFNIDVIRNEYDQVIISAEDLVTERDVTVLIEDGNVQVYDPHSELPVENVEEVMEDVVVVLAKYVNTKEAEVWEL